MAHTYASLFAHANGGDEKEAAQLKLKHTASIVLSTKRPEKKNSAPEAAEENWLSGLDLGGQNSTTNFSTNQRKSTRKLTFKRTKRAPKQKAKKTGLSQPPATHHQPLQAPVSQTAEVVKKTSSFPTLPASLAIAQKAMKSEAVEGVTERKATAHLKARLKNTGIVTSFSTNLGRGQRSASSGSLTARRRQVEKSPEQKRLDIEGKWPLAKQSRELFGDIIPYRLTAEDRAPKFVPSHGAKDYKSSGCSAIASFLGFAR